MMRCASCRCVLDAPGPEWDPDNDAEKHDPKYPDHCRGCAAWLHEQADYAEHLRRGGKPYMAIGPTGKRIA